MTTHKDELDIVREDLAELRSEMKALIDVIGKTGVDSVGAVNGKARRISRDVEKALEKAADKVYDRAAKEGQRYLSSVEEHVAERPYSSMAIALAAGLMLGRFLDRK